MGMTLEKFKQLYRDAPNINERLRLLQERLKYVQHKNKQKTGILEQDLAATKERLQKAEEVISLFMKKTEIYLQVYVDDKELRSYRDRARQYMQTYGTSGDVPTGEKK